MKWEKILSLVLAVVMSALFITAGCDDMLGDDSASGDESQEGQSVADENIDNLTGSALEVLGEQLDLDFEGNLEEVNVTNMNWLGRVLFFEGYMEKSGKQKRSFSFCPDTAELAALEALLSEVCVSGGDITVDCVDEEVPMLSVIANSCMWDESHGLDGQITITWGGEGSLFTIEYLMDVLGTGESVAMTLFYLFTYAVVGPPPLTLRPIVDPPGIIQAILTGSGEGTISLQVSGVQPPPKLIPCTANVTITFVKGTTLAGKFDPHYDKLIFETDGGCGLPTTWEYNLIYD